MSTFPNHWHANPPIYDRYGLAKQLSSLLWSVSENLHHSESYRIFGSNFAYFILILSIHPGIQNDDGGLPSIILAGQCLLVKMLITLEPHDMS